MWSAVKTKLSRKIGLRPAVEELKRSADIADNNAPIHEKEGDLKQAAFTRANAKSFKTAIKFLKQV